MVSDSSSGSIQERIDLFLKEMWEYLTPEGRSRVKEEGKKLSADDMKEHANPEAFTTENLIRKVILLLNLTILPERHFDWGGKHRRVDYRLKNENGQMFLLEAKPLNADLYKDVSDSAVSQIQTIFKLAEAQKEYEFGIASDGLKWVFIDREGVVENEFDVRTDFEKIKKRLVGEVRVVSQAMEEKITRKFYMWYNALLHGGVYNDRNNKRQSISEEDCLVSNIYNLEYDDDREGIAQTVVDRLIFIKFLQSKNIIKTDILQYLTKLRERDLNATLEELFFRVLNREKNNRVNIDRRFSEIPYLNGSLFETTRAEKRNGRYFIRVEILRRIIGFLDSFKFAQEVGEAGMSIDPEILGYIFERAMTAAERKGTGAFYTPKTITKYISENTIYPFIIDRTNEILKEKKYKESELLGDIEQLFILPATTLNDILGKVINKVTILDPACGSGAFLLAAAHVLLDLQNRIRKILNMEIREAGIKKIILTNNIFGVDINSNAIEIAKLRLWLWLVESYKPDSIEALPNIEYNIMAGNSLVGYTDISKFQKQKLSLFDFDSSTGSDITLFKLLNERKRKLDTYKGTRGKDAKKMKRELENIEEKIGNLLDREFYTDLQKKNIKFSYSEFRDMEPFHWGFEFYDIFNPEKPEEERGFDVVIGNPPYVRQEALKEIKPYLQMNYSTYHGVADLYVYFIEQGMILLRSKGYFSYIVANKWMRANYGKSLREWMKKQRIIEIIDFGDLPVFQGATTYPCIVGIQKESPIEKFLATQVKTLDFTDLDEYTTKNQYTVQRKTLNENGWSLVDENTQKLLEKLSKNGITLKEYTNGNVYYGIKTGFNKAFIIDSKTRKQLIAKDAKCSELIKPFLGGKDVKRYKLPLEKQYFIFTRRGIDIDCYPAIKEHLLEFKEELMPKPKDWKGEKWHGRKPGPYEWYEIQDSIDYHEEFEKTKIIYPNICKKPEFTIDENCKYTNQKCFIISKNDKYLLGILNSSIDFLFFKTILPKLRGDFYEPSYVIFKDFPIRTIDFDDPTDRARHDRMVKLVDRMLKLHKELDQTPDAAEKEQLQMEIRETDREIDNLVYELYDLTNEEIKIVEESIK